MLKELSELNATSGEEDAVRDYIKNKFGGEVDKLGNLFIDNNSDTLVVSHMDEPSLIITKILEDGYLKFDIIGSLKAENLISKYVTINGINGVIGIKAIHLTTKEEREKTPEINDLFIDIGAKNKSDADKFVIPGDKAFLCSEYTELGNSRIKGKAFRSRIGCSLICELLKENKSFDALLSVQGEVYARGGEVALKEKDYSFAIVLDCIENNDIVLGSGPAISLTFTNNNLTNKIKHASENAGINIQFDVSQKENFLVDKISRKNDGIPTVLISLPCKNLNSGSNIADREDISSMLKLLTELLRGDYSA